MFPLDNTIDLHAFNAWTLENVPALVAWKRQDTGIAADSSDQSAIRSVAIIGAGVMGAEIGAAYVKNHLPVTIIDRDPAALATISRRVGAELATIDQKQDFFERSKDLICLGVELAQAAKCDLIIESISEQLPAKQELFSSLQEFLSPETIFVSNTSTIPIGKLAQYVPLPERFCGLHFFHPVRERPLVEIVRGSQTAEKTVAALAAQAKAIDKLPIVVADGPGFLVNRLLLPYLTEALELLMEGASLELIEQAARDFGMAKGPFCLMDEIGLDTTLQAGWCLAEAFPERITPSPLLVAFIKSGRLGKKTKAGFFSYGDLPSTKTPFRSDPAAEEIIARWAKKSRSHSSEEIVRRLILSMVLEGARIIEEGKATDARDIDLGAIFGLGFPDRRGGLLWWADAIGAAGVVEMIEPLASAGPRLQAPELLLNMAAQGGTFYQFP